MKPKFLMLIVAIAVGTTGLTVIAIRVQQQAKEEQTRRTVQTTTTNMMRQLKPLTAPPIFPEK
jgi:uncharacterized protein HemX